MATVTTVPTAPAKRQARKPVNRFLSWTVGDVTAPLPMANIVKIDDGRGDVCSYTVGEIDAFPGAKAFELVKLDLNDGDIYHVRVVRSDLATCDCPGGTFKGKCKHSAAVVKLIALGKLGGPMKPSERFAA